jgi:hypothetical protein
MLSYRMYGSVFFKLRLMLSVTMTVTIVPWSSLWVIGCFFVCFIGRLSLWFLDDAANSVHAMQVLIRCFSAWERWPISFSFLMAQEFMTSSMLESSSRSEERHQQHCRPFLLFAMVVFFFSRNGLLRLSCGVALGGYLSSGVASMIRKLPGNRLKTSRVAFLTSSSRTSCLTGRGEMLWLEMCIVAVVAESRWLEALGA